MKLERMNEQQIRCTITSEDLKARQIKISELAYGTDKARTLFRDMMIAAENELDFEAGDEPLMIEATPINSECIILTVTQADDPEELDESLFAETRKEEPAEEAVADAEAAEDTEEEAQAEEPAEPEAEPKA